MTWTNLQLGKFQNSESSETIMMIYAMIICSHLTTCINRELKHWLSTCKSETMRRWSSSPWLLVNPWNYLSQKFKWKLQDIRKMILCKWNTPTCKMPYTALHICSVATTLFFLLKGDQGSKKVKNIILGPARNEGAYLLFCHLHNGGYSKRTWQLN